MHANGLRARKFVARLTVTERASTEAIPAAFEVIIILLRLTVTERASTEATFIKTVRFGELLRLTVTERASTEAFRYVSKSSKF